VHERGHPGSLLGRDVHEQLRQPARGRLLALWLCGEAVHADLGELCLAARVLHGVAHGPCSGRSGDEEEQEQRRDGDGDGDRASHGDEAIVGCSRSSLGGKGGDAIVMSAWAIYISV
jgi:hypothetical protein